MSCLCKHGKLKWKIVFFRVHTSNGIAQSESAQLKQLPGAESPSYSKQGQFSYTGADGVVYTVKYVADENGYQPEGAHIPKAL